MRGEFDHKSIFKGEPNPDLDAAWDQIADDGQIISIDQETFDHLNKSADTAVTVPSGYGGGYLASIEIFHQLHCLVRPSNPYGEDF